MSRLRAQNRAQQRERILGAAFGLFSEHGFADVTVSDIAEAAGISRATVFNHFGSKQGLIDSLTGLVLLAYQAMLDASLADDLARTPALVRGLFERMARGIEAQRNIQRGIFREIARLQLGFEEGGPTHRTGDENRIRVIKLMARGQERGELSTAQSPEAMASAFTALVNGTITEWLFEDSTESLHGRMRAAADIFLAGVVAGATADREPASASDPPRPGRSQP